MASKAFLENSSNPSAALPIRVGTAAALSIYFILAGRLKASGRRFKQSRSRETGRESQRSSRFEPPDEPRKCAVSKSPWFLIQDKKKNKKPKSRRDHRSYRLRHLFHFPPSCHHSPWTPSPPALRSPPSGALQAPSQGGLLGALSHLPSLSLQPAQPLLLPLPPHLGVRLLPWVGLVRHGDSSLTTESRIEGREREKKKLVFISWRIGKREGHRRGMGLKVRRARRRVHEDGGGWSPSCEPSRARPLNHRPSDGNLRLKLKKN